MRKIIIAGAGHGGLTAAAYLAEKGYDVSIYEKKSREELGYDWDDAMNNKTFLYAGIIDYDMKDIKPTERAGFFSPSLKTPILFDFELETTNYEVQRKVIYKYLLNNADKKGVKMYFNKSVDSAIIEPVRQRVIGIKVDGEEILGDLVIDSAGMYSPVKNSLPDKYDIQKSFKEGDIFYTYRALYEMEEGQEIYHGDRFNIYFKFNGIQGIAWFKVVDGLADVLIGSTVPITMDDVMNHLNALRKVQPCISNILVKGGIIVHIPLSACFSNIIGDNYAAIGDAVSMTVPINGSGITNSIYAGKLLADTITSIDLANDHPNYTKEKLWDYQVKYMSTAGAVMLSIYPIKKCLMSYNAKVLNYFFDSGVLTDNELRSGSIGEELVLTLGQIIDKVKRGYKQLPMLIRLSNAVNASKKAKNHAMKIPTVYNESAIKSWRSKYDSFIK